GAPLPVLLRARLIEDELLGNALALRTAQQRHRQPGRAVIDLHAISILKILRLILEVVHDHEKIGLRDLRKISEPRQISRLMRGDDHRLTPPWNGHTSERNRARRPMRASLS